MNRFGFVFCHGWALTPHSLLPLAERLALAHPDYAIEHFDLGYYGPPHHPHLDDRTQWIGIGHSQGFAHLASLPTPWAGLVSLNGFRWFCKESAPAEKPHQAPSGTAKRVLERMLKLLDTNPVALITEFLTRCGYPSHLVPLTQAFAQHTPNVQALRLGLHRLINVSLVQLPQAPLLAIAATCDAIVPQALSAASFNEPIAWLPDNAPHCAVCDPSHPHFNTIVSALTLWINSLRAQ